MILAAGLLVLGGLGLFVGGLATGTTSYYWGCVACCALAAVLLVVVRLRPAPRVPSAEERRAADDRAVVRPPAARPAGRTAATRTPATRAAVPTTAADDRDDEPRGRHAGRPVPADAAATTSTGAAAAVEPASEEEPAAAGSAAAGPEPAAEPAAVEPAAEPAVVEPAGEEAAPAAAAGARPAAAAGAPAGDDDPAEEDVEWTDLLRVVELRDEVLVVDEHPRYHLAGCSWLSGRETFPLPVSEARTDGFTPCALCRPDQHLADLARARRAGQK